MEARKSHDFGPEDLQHINVVLRAFPHAAQSVRMLRRIESTTGFPIKDREALLQAVGDEDVDFGTAKVPAHAAVELLPNYYFPIESPDDFLTKVADLRRQIEHPFGENVSVHLRAAEAKAPDHDPPGLSEKEIHKISGFQPGKGPGSGAISQRKS